jgi:shikimate dehydrogenase
VAAVLGWPIEHSKSPVMMNAAFAAVGLDASMVAMGVPPERFASTVAELRAIPMLGASVTIPHKIAAHAICDELAPAAIATGAVNCLALDGTRLIGYNTDAAGFVDALRGEGFEFKGKRVVLIGAGGAARAVAFGATGAGATIEVYSRSHVAWTPPRPLNELASGFAHADLVVDCTPAGLDPEIDLEFTTALPIDALNKSTHVATLVYHRRTALLERARARGNFTHDGLGMLAHQGAHAFAIWTKLPPPIDIMMRALEQSRVKSS